MWLFWKVENLNLRSRVQVARISVGRFSFKATFKKVRVGVIIYDLEAMCGGGTRKLGSCLFVSRYGFFLI